MQIAESASDSWKQFFYKGTVKSSSQLEVVKEEGWLVKWKKFFMEGFSSSEPSKRPNYFAWLGTSDEEEDSQ